MTGQQEVFDHGSSGEHAQVASMNDPGHRGPAPEGSPLTDEELRALAEGTRIIVIWSGGNGPAAYDLTFDQWGQPYAWAKFGPDAEADERLRFYNPIDFVGSERFHTRVWKAPDNVRSGNDG